MHATEPRDHVRAFLRGLERWDRWLQERLSPAIVALKPAGTGREAEYRWNVEYPLGAGSVIRIPVSLIELDPDEFRRMADGLSTYRWDAALEKAGPEGIRIVCPDQRSARF